jgi:hypothetical protein
MWNSIMDGIDLLVLNTIRDHLIQNSGEYDWEPFSKLWDIQLINLYSHLAFLRINGFTFKKKGTTYWRIGDIVEVKKALVAEKERKRAEGKIRDINPKPNSHRRCIDIDSLAESCIKELETMTFSGLNLADLKKRLSKNYEDKIMISSVKKTGGTVVFCGPKQPIFYKFSAKIPQVELA